MFVRNSCQVAAKPQKNVSKSREGVERFLFEAHHADIPGDRARNLLFRLLCGVDPEAGGVCAVIKSKLQSRLLQSLFRQRRVMTPRAIMGLHAAQ
jgi:hypothetical protein